MMNFDVIVRKVRDFHVIVKNISILNSLVLTIKCHTYKVSASIFEILNCKVNLSQKSKIVMAEWMDFVNPRPEIHVCNFMESELSSSEYFNSTKLVSKSNLDGKVSTKERISAETKSKLNIIMSPTIGIFRKLVEFDSLTLAELDNLTLKEMDYLEEIIEDIEETIRRLNKL